MKKKVLLAEDDPLDAEMTIQNLRSLQKNNEIIHFKDGYDLIQYIERNSPYENIPYEDPALILLDFKMPRINGLEALEIIKSNAATKHIPVVVFSSSEEPSDIINCYKYGVNAFVVKPVEINDFNQTVKKLGEFWLGCNETRK